MWVGNLDGRRQGLIVASSKAEAVRILGNSLKDFNDYWVERPLETTFEPRALYVRSYTRPGPWHKQEPR